MRTEPTTVWRPRPAEARLCPTRLSVALAALLLVGGLALSLRGASAQSGAGSSAGTCGSEGRDPAWLAQPAAGGPRLAPTMAPEPTFTHVYLSLLRKGVACGPIPEEEYETLSVFSSPTDRPAEEHADLNLALRGYQRVEAYGGLVDYGGAVDPYAPQLPGLFGDQRTATFAGVYRIYHWDWDHNRRGTLNTDWEVTLAGLATTRGEVIHVPARGQSIGSGYEVLVLYAASSRITLKYTREDNVVWGYTLHVEKVCVEPRLLKLYRSCNSAGRGELPALRGGQAFGRALGGGIGVAIRDAGLFMDPRSRKDWWRGRQAPGPELLRSSAIAGPGKAGLTLFRPALAG